MGDRDTKILFAANTAEHLLDLPSSLARELDRRGVVSEALYGVNSFLEKDPQGNAAGKALLSDCAFSETHRVVWSKPKKKPSKGGGALDVALAEEAIQAMILERGYTTVFVQDFLAAWVVRRACAALRKEKTMGLNVVYRLGQSPASAHQSPFSRVSYRLAEHLAARRTDSIVASNPADLDFARRLPLDNAPVLVPGTGVYIEDGFHREAARTRTRELFGVGDDQVLVGIDDTIASRSAHETVLKFCDNIDPASPLVFLFMTQGPNVAEVFRIVSEHGFANRIRFVVGVDHAKKGEFYAGLDIGFLFHSTEGCPASLQKMMLHGVACTGLGTTAITEALGSDSPYLAKTHAEVFSAIQKLASDPSLRALEASRGQRRAAELFSAEPTFAAYEALLR